MSESIHTNKVLHNAFIINSISTGPRNDYLANVDISQVNGGYYSKPEPISQFITLGIKPILSFLPNKFNYYDFGGANGLLASCISIYLKQAGFDVTTTVVDANPRYLEEALTKGLHIQQSNLETCDVEDCTLITMRGVNHYNSLNTQKKIYKNTFEQLNKNCYFISSICSGPKQDIQFKSNVINLPSLGRVYEENQIHATSVDEYINLLQESGFANVLLAGYAPPQKWCPIETWVRSNAYLEIEAKRLNDYKTLKDISIRKSNYFKHVDRLLIQLLKDKNILLTEGIPNNYNFISDIEYPIIRAYKA